MSRIQKNILAKTSLLFLLFLLCFAANGAKVYATDMNTVSTRLRITQVFLSDDKPVPDDKMFVYELSPLEFDIPMPDDTAGNVYRLMIEGTQSMETAELVFNHAGIYKYKLMVSESNNTDDYEYDDREYTIEVYVRNTNDGHLSVPEFIIRNQSGSKSEELTFSYALKNIEGDPTGSSDPTVPSTGKPDDGDDGGGGETVLTGQDIQRIFFVAALSIFSFFILLIAKRRKDEEEEIESNISANR